jgi:acetyl esterase/lipase
MNYIKFLIYVIIVGFFLQSAAFSQRYLEPVFGKVNKTSDIKYGSAINQKGVEQDLMLDIYQPEGDTIKSRPLVIFIHGGAFIFGKKDAPPMIELCSNFAKRGYVAASISYRLARAPTQKEIMDAMHDARAAVRFLRRYANKYGIDTNKIAVGGSSAGAYTALCVSYIDKQSELLRRADPDNVEGNSGNPGFGSNVQACIDLWGGLMKVKVMNSDEPPLLIIHGTNDPLVNYNKATELDSRANEVGIYHEFYPIEGAGHAPWKEMKMIDEKIAEFLFRVLIKK